MPRLFVSLDLPIQLQAAMVSLQGGLPGVRWLPADQLHLTLRFIGEVDDGALRAIRAGLPVAGLASFSCRLQGVGAFPPRGRPRVLYVGVEAGPGLLQLQAAVENRLRGLGLAPEPRPFLPHITLARLRDQPAHRVQDYLERHAHFASRPFVVQDYHLYRSRLTPQGAIHSRLETYALMASDP